MWVATITTTLMDEREAADYLQRHYRYGTALSLRQLRYEGKGPETIKCGATHIYTNDLLDNWIGSRMIRVSPAA
ncbi:MAG: hypothetical protein EB015_20270 [Methylocystaceae bacterium]|nr:hypothetical protein [Methylocystaceae bacterium]